MMKMGIGRFVGAVVLVTLLVAGCNGSTQSSNVQPVDTSGAASTGTSATTPVATATTTLEDAMIANPNLATQLIPTANLNPLLKKTERYASGATITPVSTLEANYETLFYQLSQKLNVTASSPHNVAKVNFLKSQSAAGNFDLTAQPIANNALGVTGVSFQPVQYDTTVPLPGGNRTFHVSGALLMPVGIDKTRVRGVIVYFHGTTFNKSSVGSNPDNMETHLVSQIFASQGYIVVFPDYVGQGIDWQDVHPYVLYPKVTAQTAIDMLSAVKPTIKSQYQYLDTDPKMKVFSAGYSEGGSYSLWFNSYIASTPSVLDPFYKLTHSVGMEGAYSTSVVTKGFLFGNVSKSGGNAYNIQTQALTNLVKPILSSDAFLSYAAYSVGGDFLSVFSKSYFNLDCGLLIDQSNCDVGGDHINIAMAFAQPDTTTAGQMLYAAFGKIANLSVYPGRLEIAFSTVNSVDALVSDTFLDKAPQAALLQTLQAADADLTSCADGGVSVITLAQDSVVVPNNYDSLLAKYPTKIKTALKLDQNNFMIVSPFSDVVAKVAPIAVWAPTDHLHGPIYEYIYALNIFNGY